MNQDSVSRLGARIALGQGLLFVLSAALALGQPAQPTEPTPSTQPSEPAASAQPTELTQGSQPVQSVPSPQAALPTPPVKPRTIDLPAPRQSGGLPLMEALAKPAADLDLDGSRLSMQHLSNLLWAGSGAGRSKGEPPTTLPHATEVYVLLKVGAFVYDATAHSLRQIVAQDIRGLCGLQDPRWRAPVTLVYVADLAKATRPTVAARELNAAMDAGSMVQSVSLYCASESLSASERSVANPRALGRRLRLRADQRIVGAQVVGYQQK
jgi:hypothetical protein